MNLKILCRALCGSLCIPSSKSAAHRAMILAAFSAEESTLVLNGMSEDLCATRACLEALGAAFCQTEDGFRVSPVGDLPEEAVLDCGESGSTLRFLMPICAALGVRARFVCHGRLAERPIRILREVLEEHGITFRSDFEICGKLSCGTYRLAANVSSQYVTGLMLALSLVEGDSLLTLTTEAESVSYTRLTEKMMRAAGARLTHRDDGLLIGGIRRFCAPACHTVEGDYSNSIFWLGAACGVRGLDENSTQGDRALISVLGDLGMQFSRQTDGTLLASGVPQFPLRYDATDTPDLVPALAVLCATLSGTSQIVGAHRLRLKESDRIETTAALLRALGVRVETDEDGLTVFGTGTLLGGTVDAAGDHRIAMSAALASHFATGEITVLGAECVSKSYPRFWDDFAALGGVTVPCP